MDGRVLRAVATEGDGEVDVRTELRFRQADDLVWGRYSGGAVRLGFFVGTSDGDTIRFRYTHLSAAGQTASGESTDRIEVLPDGRVRLHETWRWDSREGGGTSILEELR
jgi:hypothetical protein